MDQTLWITTAVDVAAVVVLALLVVRGARERARSTLEQRDALERLGTELKHLLEDAETRARRLEDALGAREDGLRALLADLDRVAPERGARARKPPAPSRPLVRPYADAAAAPADDAGEPVDVAELRLRRELDLALGRTRLA
jgi:hypothetical protein